nr:MAG TPA: hypothetical protein [Caudoviricetes sp.]
MVARYTSIVKNFPHAHQIQSAHRSVLSVIRFI